MHSCLLDVNTIEFATSIYSLSFCITNPRNFVDTRCDMRWCRFLGWCLSAVKPFRSVPVACCGLSSSSWCNKIGTRRHEEMWGELKQNSHQVIVVNNARGSHGAVQLYWRQVHAPILLGVMFHNVARAWCACNAGTPPWRRLEWKSSGADLPRPVGSALRR